MENVDGPSYELWVRDEHIKALKQESDFARQAFRELHSAVSDIATRIGIAAKPDWVREQLDRVLSETKFKHPA